MSTAITIKIKESDLTTLEGIASECGLQSLSTAGQFMRTFRLAAGIRALNQAINSEMMKDIMFLQGLSLGFRTDKDSGQGYSEDVVKQCLIEAVLRGAYPVGNEFNIIAGRPYLTKEFFTRKVREFPGLTDLRLSPGVPSLSSSGQGALVPYVATWRLNNLPMRLERLARKIDEVTTIDERIPVRVNSGMGADAITGKATRKMLAAIYGQLTGSEGLLPDGEADETQQHAPPSSLAALSIKLANGNGNGEHKPIDPIANIDVLLADCKTQTEVREIYDQMCGPESALNEEQRTKVSEACDRRRAAIKANRGERSNVQREPGEESEGDGKLFNTNAGVGQ